MGVLSMLFSFAIGLAVLWLVCKLLLVPVKIMWKLVVNAIGGALLLLLINFFGGLIGLSVPITVFSSLIAGVFGIPGVVVILIVQLLF